MKACVRHLQTMRNSYKINGFFEQNLVTWNKPTTSIIKISRFLMSQATSKQVFNNTQNKINMENNNTISVGNICNYSIAALVDSCFYSIIIPCFSLMQHILDDSCIAFCSIKWLKMLRRWKKINLILWGDCSNDSWLPLTICSGATKLLTAYAIIANSSRAKDEREEIEWDGDAFARASTFPDFCFVVGAPPARLSSDSRSVLGASLLM